MKFKDSTRLRGLIVAVAGTALVAFGGYVAASDTGPNSSDGDLQSEPHRASSTDRPEASLLFLESAATFESLEDPKQRSIAYFLEAGKVITHPRCVNCHPAGDRPLQGEYGEPHEPMVVRGDDNHGAVGMQCQTCHGDANYDPGRMPGHSEWHLAPIEMAWEGLSLRQICQQLKDPARNGDRSLDDIVHHMEHDGLVAWGWQPGEGRQPAPGDQKTFAGLIRAWVDSGAACPGDS